MYIEAVHDGKFRLFIIGLSISRRPYSGFNFLYSFVPSPDLNEPSRQRGTCSRESLLLPAEGPAWAIFSLNRNHWQAKGYLRRFAISSTNHEPRILYRPIIASLASQFLVIGSTRGRGGNGIHVSTGNLLRTTSSYLVNPLVPKSVPAASEPSDRLCVYKRSQFHSLMSSAKRLYLNKLTVSCFITH